MRQRNFLHACSACPQKGQIFGFGLWMQHLQLDARVYGNFHFVWDTGRALPKLVKWSSKAAREEPEGRPGGPGSPYVCPAYVMHLNPFLPTLTDMFTFMITLASHSIWPLFKVAGRPGLIWRPMEDDRRPGLYFPSLLWESLPSASPFWCPSPLVFAPPLMVST